MANTNTDNTKVVTGKVRFSYVSVFEPKTTEDGKEKYSVSLLIDKKDKKTIDAVNKAVENAKQAGISKFGGKIPAVLKLPTHDGDVERPDDEAYCDKYFINAKSNTKPGLLDRKGCPIIDPTEFYSGCYGHASVNFYAFNSNGNKGIACGLNNLMKTEDGEPLAGRSKAEDDFADLIDSSDSSDDEDFLN